MADVVQLSEARAKRARSQFKVWPEDPALQAWESMEHRQAMGSKPENVTLPGDCEPVV